MLDKIDQKRIELLDETVKYYSTDPDGRRCAVDGCCYYHPKTLGLEGKSEGCAIGRLLSRRMALQFDNNGGDSIDELFEILPMKIKKYGIVFLTDLQMLHDFDRYWTCDGLSIIGKNKVKEIKEKIIEGDYN